MIDFSDQRIFFSKRIFALRTNLNEEFSHFFRKIIRPIKSYFFARLYFLDLFDVKNENYSDRQAKKFFFRSYPFRARSNELFTRFHHPIVAQEIEYLSSKLLSNSREYMFVRSF